ncbi:hypothetical protein CERSUDRAFT_116920 [Gelatoporia subvermispora B]|uniref:Protein root UVB sensitive/RUS domain-containing protein n=1 Tax=Ceriporiopsis subvermispora (strain B) TaxID=914234 RepID=M2QRA7_CERS8|nr:hypothetical protein CERSUDRAFT_116920 [Gelatoporia subvermispora B]
MSNSMDAMAIQEKDEGGHITAEYLLSSEFKGTKTLQRRDTSRRNYGVAWRQLFSGIFLPAGYPNTVSPDYLHYQIFNGLQAGCSSIASLLASRAVLEGHGVGEASASATNAMLVNIIQDVVSRLITIGSGYYLGTSLFPEAKKYRLLADVYNDAAVVLDVISPLFTHWSISLVYPFIRREQGFYLRVLALCLSGSFRALCGMVAGGSKAALTMHFATAGPVPGDIGDLNAKDGSKETVLALIGMLLGTFVIKHVDSGFATYAVLSMLILTHLAINFVAVRGVVMRTFNRHRAAAAWASYRRYEQGIAQYEGAILTPELMAVKERIFADPTLLMHPLRPEKRLGHCHLGASLSTIFLETHRPCPPSRTSTVPNLTSAQLNVVLQTFENERYILWLRHDSRSESLQLVVCFKTGHQPIDRLKGWIHAQELAIALEDGVHPMFEKLHEVVQTSLARVQKLFPLFLDAARGRGWMVEEGLLVGIPYTISVRPTDPGMFHDVGSQVEDRKRV